MPEEEMNVEKVRDALVEVLRLQYTSATNFAVGAGGLSGLQYRGLAQDLWNFAQAELQEIQVLVEKLTALGGDPPTQSVEAGWDADQETFVRLLVEHERRVMDALHSIIPDTGQESRSEAMEHMLEHAIMRKQRQVDLLSRSIGMQA